MSLLCLKLTGANPDAVLQQVKTFAPMVDLFDFNMNLFPAEPYSRLDPLLSRITQLLPSNKSLILSLSPSDEIPPFLDNLMSSKKWIWLEVDYERPLRKLSEAAETLGFRIIRAYTDLSGNILEQPVSKLANLLRSMATGNAVPKLVAQCNSSRALLNLSRLALATTDIPEKILVGLGEYGYPSQILAEKLNALWTYTSASESTLIPPRILNQLYRYRKIDQKTPLYAVTGNPIAHSQSPEIHNTWLQENKLPGTYIPIRCDNLNALVETADILGITGISVTIPHKEEALRISDFSDSLSRRIRAANTLVRAGDGWRARNTDASGFMASLLRALNLCDVQSLKGKKALIIGAGGAARAVVHGLADAGMHLVVLNRTHEKASQLAEEVGALSGSLAPESHILLKGIDIAIQTTSVGMFPHADKNPLPWWNPSGCMLVYDIIYTPAETQFLKQAREKGVPTLNGKEMLRNQAMLQFEIFTGVKPVLPHK